MWTVGIGYIALQTRSYTLSVAIVGNFKGLDLSLAVLIVEYLSITTKTEAFEVS